MQRRHMEKISSLPVLPMTCPALTSGYLALTPASEGLLGQSGSWQEFALVLQGLAQMGSLLQRAIAWPSLPCNTLWISG